MGRPIADREAWQKMGERYGARAVIARAETLLQEPMPPPSDDAYLDFSRTGNRKRGERVIFDRRRRVGALVLAECLENRGRFLKGTFGHPVPRVAGKLQQAGGAARATVLKTEFGQSEDTLAIDLRSAYPVKELTKLVRTFRFVRAVRGSLTVIDEVQFSTPQAFGSALVTLGQWRQDGKDLVVGTGKGSVRVRIVTTGAGFRIEPAEIDEDLPGDLVPVRLGIELDRPVKEASITVEISG